MSKNILYILGAGASANALPTVEEMPIRMKIFYLYNILNINTEKENELIFLKELKDLITEIDKRRTFDTYAKEIYLKEDLNNKKSNILKKILVSYLNFEQENTDSDIRKNIIKMLQVCIKNLYIKELLKPNKNTDLYDNNLESILSNYINNLDDNKIKYFDLTFFTESLKNLFEYDKNLKYKHNKDSIDQRYVSFIIDIIDTIDINTSLNKIKIFSWNYDSQFDKAINKLEIDANSKKKNMGIVNILKNIEIKINGSIKSNKIKFAWEQNDDYYNNILSNIDVNFFSKISDVIIIGYSFPFSNRKIDSLIFNYLLRLSKNINFYIQTIQTKENDDKNFNDTREALESLMLTSRDGAEINKKNIKIFKKYDNKSFFIPPHY